MKELIDLFRKQWIINSLTIIFLLLLPYLIFDGKLYLGGDDTKIFYSYPIEFLTNVTFFSWFKLSSLGINGASHYIFPFLSVWSILSLLISSKVALNYLGFSLPLVLGFLYFQKAVKELFSYDDKKNIQLFLGSLFYILSPILMINQMFVFLISIWLLGLIPIIVFYFLKYLKTSDFKNVLISAVWCLVLGQAVNSIPWLLGFILPIFSGLLITAFLYKKKEILYFLKHFFIFSGFVLISQSFWLLEFVTSYINLGQNSFASKFLSQGFIDTFTPTVLSTATGTIIYPLFNLFIRQIPFDFVWKLKDVFINFYDKTFILNLFFVLIFIIGVFNFRKYLNSRQRKIYIFIFASFLFSLYFFTVNIGPLKDLFLLFKYIPGFIMFRNFYDKFAPGYVLIYSTLISVSLVIVTQKYIKRRNLILFLFFVITLINFIPVKETVNSPLWTTKDIYKTINFPKEYLNFMTYIKNNVSSTNNILSVPFGSSAYTVVKDDNSNHVYAGVSPVKIFSGVNDLSGHLSFNFTKEADIVDSLIIKRKYKEFNKVMFEHNINYVLLTRNVPEQLKASYLFNPDLFDVQDKDFVQAITDKKIAESSNKNYVLYKAKKTNSLISASDVFYQKINQIKYVIYIKNISKEKEFDFLDTYHAGWKLFLTKSPSLNFCHDQNKNSFTGASECKAKDTLFDINDISFSLKKAVFENKHFSTNNGDNKWVIDPKYIKNNFDKSYYVLNKDGSIDIQLILYFAPQNYFYLGSLISFFAFVLGLVFIRYKK